MTENPFSLKINYVDIPTNFREVIRALGHDGPINCLAKIGNNQFISGSSDNSIKFWNLDEEELKPYEVLDKCIGKVGLLLLLKEDRLCSTSYELKKKLKHFMEILRTLHQIINIMFW